MILSESFGTTVKTARTVCSRTTGATSEKPVTCHGISILFISAGTSHTI